MSAGRQRHGRKTRKVVRTVVGRNHGHWEGAGNADCGLGEAVGRNEEGWGHDGCYCGSRDGERHRRNRGGGSRGVPSCGLGGRGGEDPGRRSSTGGGGGGGGLPGGPGPRPHQGGEASGRSAGIHGAVGGRVEDLARYLVRENPNPKQCWESINITELGRPRPITIEHTIMPTTAKGL
jgi:hypothetical protein